MNFVQIFLDSNNFQVQVELGHLKTKPIAYAIDLNSLWCNDDGQHWCLVTINNLPQASPLLVPTKDANLVFGSGVATILTSYKNLYTNQHSMS